MAILRVTTDQLAYFHMCPKYLSESFRPKFLSKYQRGFCKGYSTQYCLLSMLEKWKSAVNKEKPFGALLTDLSKDLIIFLLNFWLLNVMPMDLPLQH